MKWMITQQPSVKARRYWEKAIGDGWCSDFGIDRYRTTKVIYGAAVESDAYATVVEFEGNLASYLIWYYKLRIKGGKKMLYPGWLSEKGALRT